MEYNKMISSENVAMAVVWFVFYKVAFKIGFPNYNAGGSGISSTAAFILALFYLVYLPFTIAIFAAQISKFMGVYELNKTDVAPYEFMAFLFLQLLLLSVVIIIISKVIVFGFSARLNYYLGDGVLFWHCSGDYYSYGCETPKFGDFATFCFITLVPFIFHMFIIWFWRFAPNLRRLEARKNARGRDID